MKKRAKWKCVVCGEELASNEPQKKEAVTVWCTKCNLNLTYPIKAATADEALDLFHETYKRDDVE